MTKTYWESLFKDDVNVWNFEFWSLLFHCYLGFVICYFHQLPLPHIKNVDESNSQSAIRNSKFLPMPYAPCAFHLLPHAYYVLHVDRSTTLACFRSS